MFCTLGQVRLGLCVALLTLGAGSATAHPSHGQDDSIYTVVKIKMSKDRSELQRLATEGYDVAGIDLENGTADILLHSVADKTSLAALNAQVVSTSLLDTALAPDSNFKTSEEIKTILQQYADNYPGIARVESIGKSLENRDIWALKISDNPDVRELNEPTVLFNGMHHAREVMSPEVPLDIAEYLLTRYGADADVTKWVEGSEIWILPMFNVDGNNKVWNGSSMWRKNVRNGYGVDINRNYPYAWGTCQGSSGSTFADDYRGPSAASEPETQVMMNFITRIQPVFSISFHSYSEIVIYPYGCNGRRSETREVIEPFGRAMAQSIRTDSGRSTYSPGTAWELLYSVDGGDIDWMYTAHHVIPYVIELNSSSAGFQPSYNLRQPTVERVRPAWSMMLNRLNQSGIRGVVRGASGNPVPNAMITVASLAKGSDFAPITWPTKADGTYHFVLNPGMYRLTYEVAGATQSRDVTIGADRADMDIDL